MRFMILLQIISAILYYWTAPFSLHVAAVILLIINTASLMGIFAIPSPHNRPEHRHFRLCRMIFTVSLFLLGCVIDLAVDIETINLTQGLANDAEVLLSGMLLGMLWHYELSGLRLPFRRSTR